MNTVILRKKKSAFLDPRGGAGGCSCPDQYQSNPYPDRPLNTLLIGYQYPLQSIDYIMFSAVTRISAVHFFVLKQLQVCLSEQTPVAQDSKSPQQRPPPSDCFCNPHSQTGSCWSGNFTASRWITNLLKCQHEVLFMGARHIFHHLIDWKFQQRV